MRAIPKRASLPKALVAAGAAAAFAAQAQPVPYTSLQRGAGTPSDAATAASPSAGVSGASAAPAQPSLSGPGGPVPYSQLAGQAPVASGSPLRDAVEAARRGDVNRATALQAQLSDPVARKLVTWAMIDSAGSMLSFEQLDQASRDLEGWPRAARRQAAAERALEAGAVAPTRVIAWFGGRTPQTAQGAMALASALQLQGRGADAQALIKSFWRDRTFEADVQSRMLARFGAYLTQDDHDRRLENLLYGSQGPATRAMIQLVQADQQALAAARIALRNDRSDANETAALVPPALQSDPGLAFDRAHYYRKHGLDVMAVGLLKTAATAQAPSADACEAMWTERRALMFSALQAGDAKGAYAVVAAHGMVDGQDYAEAEFFAGWIALSRLHDPALAERHFAAVQKSAVTPVTLSRALYWRGRAAEARGDKAAAQGYWRQGAAYYTAFYGQLSAERAGLTRIDLGLDPKPTAEDRARFEARDIVRAARMLGDAGEREAFRTFVLSIADQLDTAVDQAMLIDMARMYGDQEIALRAARAAAARGIYLPERAYPVLAAPTAYGAPEPAFTLAIVRQESGFDPSIRSSVGARGLMQLMPTTASILARKTGLDYSPSRLDEPDYNLRLGSAYLGQLTDQFNGSYLLAAAGYNAGPGRAAQWASQCGDPRQSSIDPADFVECIPFSETRNYVMRVLESVGVYRARLAGGSAPLQLSADLKRGGWTPGATAAQAIATR